MLVKISMATGVKRLITVSPCIESWMQYRRLQQGHLTLLETGTSLVLHIIVHIIEYVHIKA
jgi:hypothetical protein